MLPLPQTSEERFVADTLRRLGALDSWSEQFAAIDDVRRLVRFAPKALVVGGHLRKTVSLITALIDSLRSALAKNALRCMGELFVTFGKRMDSEIDASMPVILRRATDTNAFIAEEAECCIRDVCRIAAEAKLLPMLLGSMTHRQPRIRERTAWCLAMLTQRIRVVRGPGGSQAGEHLRSIAEAASKALGDANADVRLAAKVAAVTLVAASTAGVLDECLLSPKLLAAGDIPGVDPAAFDVFDPETMAHRGGPTVRSMLMGPR